MSGQPRSAARRETSFMRASSWYAWLQLSRVKRVECAAWAKHDVGARRELFCAHPACQLQHPQPCAAVKAYTGRGGGTAAQHAREAPPHCERCACAVLPPTHPTQPTRPPTHQMFHVRRVKSHWGSCARCAKRCICFPLAVLLLLPASEGDVVAAAGRAEAPAPVAAAYKLAPPSSWRLSCGCWSCACCACCGCGSSWGRVAAWAVLPRCGLGGVGHAGADEQTCCSSSIPLALGGQRQACSGGKAANQRWVCQGCWQLAGCWRAAGKLPGTS